MPAAGSRIVVFDGACNLCNGIVRFIIRRDPQRKLRFVPMHSDAGRKLIDRHYAPGADLDTFLLIDDDACLVRGDAALAIAGELKWPWPLCTALRVVPRAWRDRIYRFIADHRYSLFGRRSACAVPDRDIGDRFLS